MYIRVDRQSRTCKKKNNTTRFYSLMGIQERLQWFFLSNTLPSFATDMSKWSKSWRRNCSDIISQVNHFITCVSEQKLKQNMSLSKEEMVKVMKETTKKIGVQGVGEVTQR